MTSRSAVVRREHDGRRPPRSCSVWARSVSGAPCMRNPPSQARQPRPARWHPPRSQLPCRRRAQSRRLFPIRARRIPNPKRPRSQPPRKRRAQRHRRRTRKTKRGRREDPRRRRALRRHARRRVRPRAGKRRAKGKHRSRVPRLRQARGTRPSTTKPCRWRSRRPPSARKAAVSRGARPASPTYRSRLRRAAMSSAPTCRARHSRTRWRESASQRSSAPCTFPHFQATTSRSVSPFRFNEPLRARLAQTIEAKAMSATPARKPSIRSRRSRGVLPEWISGKRSVAAM